MKGTLLSYWKKLECPQNLERKKLTVQGKVTIFKTLAISNVIHIALVTNVPYVIIDQLNKI